MLVLINVSCFRSNEQSIYNEIIDFSSPLDSNLEPPARQRTQEKTNIFFLKAHKCASSTVQNILMRFGLERGLNFVLPKTFNYIGNPDVFRPDMIDEDFKTYDGKYNIFTHHSRYDTDGVRSVMYEDAIYITILRHPAEVYESIFSYYKFSRVFNTTFEAILKSPENVQKINKRYFNRIGFNQMSFDLGFPEEDFNSSTKVSNFIRKIDSEFHLVMMSEWMEASLVLLADIMNWPLENVVSLKLNSRPSNSIYVMSDFERQRVVELNSVDNNLYNYFLNKFRARIRDYGEERMKKEIEILLALNFELQFRCVEEVNTKGYGHTQAYKLRDEGDRLCYMATQGELPFTEELRNVQQARIHVINKLEAMLQDYNDL